MASEERAAFLRRIMAIARNIKNDVIHKGHLSETDLVIPSNAAFEAPAHFFSHVDIKNDLLGLGLSTETVELLLPAISSFTAVYQRAFQGLSSTPSFPGMSSVHEIMENMARYFREVYTNEVLPVLRERIISFFHVRDENRFAEVDETEPTFNTVSYLKTPHTAVLTLIRDRKSVV